MYDPRFLPICKEDLDELGWDYVDVIIISADAYVDHPCFGHAVVGRLLEHEGLRVAILPQPNWRDDLRDFKKLGKPRLFFAISSGMDSMVNHYTAAKRLRSDDAFTPGNKAGFRPDYATYTYAKILKKLYPDVPLLIGGLESSLRRVTHYDYWSNKLKPSILFDTQADILVYGMGEKPLKEIVRLLKKGVPFSSLNSVPQTAYLAPKGNVPKNSKWEDLRLYSYEECLESKRNQIENCRRVDIECNKWFQHRILQDVAEQTVVINPAYPPMEYGELDESFEYPYAREPHPRYKKRGNIPAFDMIKFSINTHRGCFGGCSFCAINAHQGKFIASRSRESILREVEIVTNMEGFAGTITDLGGPSANMYNMRGRDPSRCQKCARASCLTPNICDNMDTHHAEILSLYREVRNHPKVKHLFIGSGVRYDMLLQETNDEELRKDHEEYARELIDYHVSGRLKVAPEHTSDAVLKLMRKPSFTLFHKFKEFFDDECKRIGKKQQLIPYFISSHPGCTEADMAELALETKQLGFQLEQVQDFTPTPMTIATEMFYAEMTPDGKPLFVAKTPEEKANQKQFFFWYIPANRPHLREVLERLKMGKVSRLLLSRTAMAEGKEYFPSKEREQNEDFRNREMQKRDERTNALRPKKEKVKNRWRDEGYEGRSFNEGRGGRFGENRGESQREPREFQFREERFSESRGNRFERNEEGRENWRNENRDRFEREGERQERRGFHSERRFDDRRGNVFEDRRDFDRNGDRRGNQQNAPFREHRNVEDKNRFNSGEINLASRRSHGKGFKKPTFKK
ncbi:YgiQ family radical SAM protein [Fibrobacter succinogenes]|uniref:YgiQ family radical SAM protein n=1 Tax=Fibrobacter succinogenes TaxID=833 RepID=UPI0026EBD9C9|nr:YgiQ family radical SAM protein [Fibrobacter succinogenes]